MIPVHPQPYPGQPDTLRWVVPAGVLTVIGPLAAAPAPLAALRADGTLSEIATEPTAVVTRLGPGRGWRADGPRVRTAIHAALDEPAGWISANGAGDNSDSLLSAMVRDLLAGAAGHFARSHGGAIDLVRVHDDVVTVRLTGACHGCPAARITLHQRLERELRRRYPALLAVVDAENHDRVSLALRELPYLLRVPR
jgi:Fe-S cluster biogenesis protein NfuA